MIAGHTEFSPDFCFGVLKKRFQASQVSTLADIADVVQRSSEKKVNLPQLLGDEDGKQYVPTYDWQNFLAPHLKPLRDIKSYHLFR